MSGLASLTANYTDSEDEDQVRNDEDDENTRDSVTFPSGVPSHLIKSATGTPNSEAASAKSTPKQKQLVSYGDFQDETDDKEDKDAEPVPMELESDEEAKEAEHSKAHDSSLNRSTSTVQVDAWNEGGKLPPEPTELCSPRIQESVCKAWRKKQDYGYDMNAVIQRKKAFRNPSIYEKLIQYCEIDEHGTNFPKDLYDGHLFGKESYYDELAKVQKIDMERREKAAKERSAKMAAAPPPIATTIPHLSSSSKDEPKRKSKWDQVGGGSAPVVRVSASTSATKSIPAYGALKK